MSNTAIYDSDSEPEGSRYDDSDEESLVDVDSPADGYFERREHPQTTYVPNPSTQPQQPSEEDKAREAAAERREQRQRQEASASAGERERERPPSHHSQPRSPVWAVDENTPLLDAGPAGPPPDYAAATADRRGHGGEGSYGSVSESAFSSDHPLVRNGLLNEQGMFGQRNEPQSMRDTADSPNAGDRGTGLRGGGASTEGEGFARGDEERGFIRRHWDRDWNGRRRWTRHFKAKRLLTWLAVFGILVLILMLSGAFEDAQDNGGFPSGDNGRNNPEKNPSWPFEPSDPSDPGDGDGEKDPTNDSPMPPHHRTSQCPYSTFSTPKKYGFASPTNFSLLEFIEGPTERSFFNDHIVGTIQISAAPPNQTDPIEVWISVALSGPLALSRLRAVRDEEGMEILFPDVSGDVKIAGEVWEHGRWGGFEESCLSFSVAVLVRPGTRLDGLEISSANLDVKVEHGVFDGLVDGDDDDDRDHDADVDMQTKESHAPAFEHVESTSITTVRGKVHAAYLSSRTTYVETTSSSISGTYALRDLLSVKSTSGSIGIDVRPTNASAEEPDHSADFRASSSSGSIDVGYLTDGIGGEKVPERDYTTRVKTSSSQIKGSYILGSNARFESNSGQMDLKVLPYYSDKTSTLHTDSGSAKTKLRLLSPYTTSSTTHFDPRSDVLGHLKSTHKSTSGQLHLTYPDEWEGVIDGSSTSGSIKVRGEDVEILVDEDIGKGIPGYGKGKSVLKHVTARKGFGESRLGFKTVSGAVDVLVGEE